jgi:hypothetical protein
MRLNVILLVILTAGITACAARTSVSGTWVKPEAKGTSIERALIVTLASKTSRRSQFDSELSRHIGNDGTIAIAASALLDPGIPLTRALVEQMVIDNNIDGVIVTRVTSRRVVPESITSKTDSKTYRSTGQPYGTFETDSTFNFVQYDYKPDINTSDYMIAKYDLTVTTEVYEVQQGTIVYRLDAVATNQTDVSSMINTVANKIGRKLRGAGLTR